MIKINETIIVEGKYDKIKLASVVDTFIIVTNGFGIFKDTEKLKLIRYYAKKTGIVILTDSDNAGRKIRSYINGAVRNTSAIKNICIPDIFGKEKRKVKASAEGKLGVEGIDVRILAAAFEHFGVTLSDDALESNITNLTMYDLGLIGGVGSNKLRKRLQSSLGLPLLLSTTALTEILGTMMKANELSDIVHKLKDDETGSNCY